MPDSDTAKCRPAGLTCKLSWRLILPAMPWKLFGAQPPRLNRPFFEGGGTGALHRGLSMWRIALRGHGETDIRRSLLLCGLPQGVRLRFYSLHVISPQRV